MAVIITTVEIAAPPEAVRATLLDFANIPTWHTSLIKSITPLTSADPLAPGSKLRCELVEFEFESTITQNTPSVFEWQGPPVKTVSGLHTFIFEPSKVTEGGTTFVQKEVYSGGVSFLLQSWLLGKKIIGQFNGFNEDLKRRVEGSRK